MIMTIAELKLLKESVDKIEFKEARHNFPFAGGKHTDQDERRKCFLGYVVALANEKGGMLVLGMTDKPPRKVVGSDFALGETGSLVDETFERLGIRIETEELYENTNRVLVIKIPSRPAGKLMKFEGVPLMRTGESLRNMSDEEMFKILSEQEPDFSAIICKGLTTDDLDLQAIENLKIKYAQKQNNPSFRSLPIAQILSDLKLSKYNKLTYAALILLGKEDKIREYLAQARTVIEYRRTETKTEHDNRIEIQKPLFLAIDDIWNYINQPASNPKHHIRQKAYIFDLAYFNEEVIREAVMNAIVHRNYNITSNIFIRQFPNKIEISNPGGFPIGVSKENILKVDSTPRSELLSEILLKTGLVEKSGQGVDKIFGITLSEGKPAPDYSKSDDFTVRLTISAEIKDEAFHIWINQEQEKRNENDKLGYFDIYSLSEIKEGKTAGFIDKDVIKRLEQQKLIHKSGETSSTKYQLNEIYYELADIVAQIGGYLITEIKHIIACFENSETNKIGDFEQQFGDAYSRDKIRYLIEKLVKDNVLSKEGIGRGTTYKLNRNGYENENVKFIIEDRLRKLDK